MQTQARRERFQPARHRASASTVSVPTFPTSRDHYGIDAIAATKTSHHHDHVFLIDRRDGEPWIARAFSPARPRAGIEGDAAILRFLERHDYPAERLAIRTAAVRVASGVNDPYNAPLGCHILQPEQAAA